MKKGTKNKARRRSPRKRGWRVVNALIVTTTIALLIVQFQLVTTAQTAVFDAPPRRIVQAGGTPDASSTEEEGPPAVNICQERVKEVADVARKEFGEFINVHFAQPKPTSELIAEAMVEYGKYRKLLQAKVDSYGREGGGGFGDTSKDISGCPQALEIEFKLLEAMIRQHVLQSAYAKKTTILMKKYQRINAQLETLNFTIAEMYGQLGSFSQKLPCYTEKCT